MKTKFKKWIASILWDMPPSMESWNVSLEDLIRCMWAINRERGYYRIGNMQGCIHVTHDEEDGKYFYYSDHNNSEQDALTAALKYIYEQETEG